VPTDFASDVRQAARRHLRRPGFALTVVLTLALGIGAATSAFSIAHNVLFQPSPWPHADRLASVYGVDHERRSNPATAPTWNSLALSWPDWRDLQEVSAFEDLAAWHSLPMAFGEGRRELVHVFHVSASYLSVFGGSPALGRPFSRDEDISAGHVVLITHDTWQARFAGQPDVLDERVWLGHPSQNGRQALYRVVGVLPPAFEFSGPAPEFLLPTGLFPPSWREPGREMFRIVARTRAGVSSSSAATMVNAVIRGGDSTGKKSARVIPIVRERAARAAPTLGLLAAAASLLLLIACANAAGLLLGETRVRRGEMAVRAALGASRARMSRQLIVEHLLLGAAAAAAGLVLAIAFTGASAAFIGEQLAELHAPRIDFAAAAIALSLGILSAVTFGAGPAMVLLNARPSASLGDGTRSGTPRVAGQRVVVAAQLALALVLVACAALLGETIARLSAEPLGFSPQKLAIVDISVTRPTMAPWTPLPQDLSTSALETAASRRPVEGRMLHTSGLLEALEALPGIERAAGTSSAPFFGTPIERQIVLEGSAPGSSLTATQLTITPGYFHTLQIPILKGEGFARTDHLDRGVMVSLEFERRFLDGNGIGRRFRFAGGTDALFVVRGVVGDVRVQKQGEDAFPAFYRMGGFVNQIAVRSTGDPAQLFQSVREAIAGHDPQVVVTAVTPMRHRLAASLAEERFRAGLSVVFGTAALILAAVGLYGLAMRSVIDRTPELGVRMALGAGPREIRLLVMRDGARTVTLGCIAGLPAALISGQLLRTYLFGVAPASPHVLALACGVLAGAALIAMLMPARSAGRIDPVAALRR
jgi:putative ABC transport system permease protein